eukprot:jgi/Mesvir1/18503/Mv14348-RA.1
MASGTVTILAIFVCIALLLALIYTNTRNDPAFAARMPKFVVDFVTDMADERTEEQKKKDEDTKKAQADYSKDVDAALKKAKTDKVDLVKVWKQAVHNAFSVRLTDLRSARDKMSRGSKEREAANSDVDQFEKLYPFLEYVFERDMREDATAVLSPMIPIVKAVGASESTVDYIVRSPQEWVNTEKKNAKNVANYVIHVFAKEADFAVR